MDDKRARFEGQVLPHLDAAYRFARWLCRPGEADDVVQDAVLRAFRGFDALRGSDAKAWLLTIVRNCHLTAVKQQQRRALVPLPEENDAADGHAMIASDASPESETINSDQKRVLDRLVASLPEEHRTVLMLREIEEMDYAQPLRSSGMSSTAMSAANCCKISRKCAVLCGAGSVMPRHRRHCVRKSCRLLTGSRTPPPATRPLGAQRRASPGPPGNPEVTADVGSGLEL